MKRLVLALDMGTSSTRSALFDMNGRRLLHTTAQRKYRLITDTSGRAEIPVAALRRAVLECLEETFSSWRDGKSPIRGQVAAVGISCFWHSLIGLGRDGKALTPVITWADSRCREDAAALRDHFSEEEIHARTGCMLRSSFWPAKLRWLRRTQPSLFRRVREWISPADWIMREICGVSGISHAMASGTGLYDPARLDWDPVLLEYCKITPAMLGTPGDTPLRATRRATLTRFPELDGADWYPAIGDGAASNLGSGATQPGYGAINYGTSAAMREMRSGARPRAPFGLFCYRVDSERYLVGGAISNAGNLHAWCRDTLRLPEDDQALDQAMEARRHPQPGLLVLPFWTAERAPDWNENDTGTITGLTLATKPLDLLQAISEGTFQRLAEIADRLQGRSNTKIKWIIGGGITSSRVSVQRLADVLGQPLYINAEPEASLRGAAIFALEKIEARIAASRPGALVRPNRTAVTAYAKQRLQLRRLAAKLAS